MEEDPLDDLNSRLQKWRNVLHDRPSGISLSPEEILDLEFSLQWTLNQLTVLRKIQSMWDWISNQTRVDIGEDENGGYEHRSNDTNYYTLEKVILRAMKGESGSSWEKDS
jgi:hypothetical protein